MPFSGNGRVDRLSGDTGITDAAFPHYRLRSVRFVKTPAPARAGTPRRPALAERYGASSPLVKEETRC